MKNKLPVAKMILLVTAPFLTFNTEVLTIRFYAIKVCDRVKQFQSIVSFLPYCLRIPFEIVNNLAFFLTKYFSFFICYPDVLRLPSLSLSLAV